MKFKDCWHIMKENRLLRGATKAELETAYNFRKQIEDVKKECQQRIDAIHEQEKQCDLYIAYSTAYCSMLEILYEQELE